MFENENYQCFFMQSTYLLLCNYVIDVKSGQVFAECLQSLNSYGIYEWNPFDLLINYCIICTANVVRRHYVVASLGSTVYTIFIYIHQQYNKQIIHIT